MKKIILLIAIISIGCNKDNPEPITETQTVTQTQTNNVLYQEINGTVTTDHSYQIIVYEEIGGQFEQTIINTYTGNTFPKMFEDEINNKFYYELTLHNFSTFTTSGNGIINATVIFMGDTLFLEADENTWHKNIISKTYNN